MADAKSIIMLSLAITVFFIMINNIIMPQYAGAGSANVSGTGLSTTTYQSLLLVVFIGLIGAVIYSFLSGKK